MLPLCGEIKDYQKGTFLNICRLDMDPTAQFKVVELNAPRFSIAMG